MVGEPQKIYPWCEKIERNCIRLVIRRMWPAQGDSWQWLCVGREVPRGSDVAGLDYQRNTSQTLLRTV